MYGTSYGPNMNALPVSPAVNVLDAIRRKLSRCFIEYMFEILFMDWY